MILNSILSFFQKTFEPYTNSSLILKNIDFLILISIIVLLVLSSFMNSDFIGYTGLVTIILTLVKLMTQKGAKFYISRIEIFLVMFFMAVLISVAGSTLFYLSLKGFIKTCIYIAFYFCFVSFLKDNPSKLKYIFYTLIGIAFAESSIAIYQNSLSISEISGWQDTSRLNPEEIITRVYGTLKPYNPNLFGGYLLSILPVTLFSAVLPIIKKRYVLGFVGSVLFLLTALAIVQTGCRGAYIGLLFQIILILALIFKYLKPQFKKVFTLISVCVASIIIFFILSSNSLKARIFSIFAMREDSSNSFRFNVYQSCIHMFKDNWLLGIGVGNQNFREIYGLYMKTGFDALSAYNIYLETALESGIIALVSFWGYVICLIVSGFKFLKNSLDEEVLYVAIGLISILGIMAHGVVDTVFFRPQIQFVFYIMLGVLRVFTIRSEYDS